MKRFILLLIAVFCTASAYAIEASTIKTTNGVELVMQDSTCTLKQGFNKANLGSYSKTFDWFKIAQQCLWSDGITEFTIDNNVYKVKTDTEGNRYITSTKIFNNMKIYQKDINEIILGLFEYEYKKTKSKIKYLLNYESNHSPRYSLRP